jgi:Spy/CpxP family protein refolding chaperone
MRRLISATGFALVASALLLLPMSYAQDAKKADDAKPAAKKERAEPRGRVPNYYGRLGLSDEQKTKVYAIQDKYDDQIQALQKQIAEIRTKQEAEIAAVLTDSQKKILAEIVDAAKKKKAETAKKKSDDEVKKAGDGDKK